jgi:hypothetical protein
MGASRTDMCGLQLILHDHNELHLENGKLGDAHGWGCLLLSVCCVCISLPPQKYFTNVSCSL